MDKIYNAHTDLYKINNPCFNAGKELISNSEQNKNFLDVVAKRQEIVADRVSKGEEEVSTPMGGSTFTATEWDKLMQSVDSAIEEMRQRIRDEQRASQRRAEIKREKAKKLKKLRLRVRQQIVHREISSNFYSVKVGANGIFVVNNKVTGRQYTFMETECRIYQDHKSSKIFLVSTEVYETTKCIEVDEVLKSMIERFFEIEDLETEELTIEETP